MVIVQIVVIIVILIVSYVKKNFGELIRMIMVVEQKYSNDKIMKS